MTLQALRRAAVRRDAGFTLVELLVAVILFAGLSTGLLAAVMSISRASDDNRVYNDLNEEARLVLNRMSRELREASRITAVTNPSGPAFNATGDSSITFEVDFDGDGVIEPAAADPEEITYIYDYSERQLMISAGGSTVPVLAANVEEFALTFRSRLIDRRLQFDGLTSCDTGGGAKDGRLEWSEVDRAQTGGLGNCNGVLDVELPLIDSVQIDVTVLEAPKSQSYKTQVDLRNVTS